MSSLPNNGKPKFTPYAPMDIASVNTPMVSNGIKLRDRRRTSSVDDTKSSYDYGSISQAVDERDYGDEREFASDGEIDNIRSYGPDDDFNDLRYSNRALMTGRQRRKLVARSKGSDFQARRMKRRVYSCCVCSEIDIQQLLEYLSNTLKSEWNFKLYGDVLRLYKTGLSDNDNKLSPMTESRRIKSEYSEKEMADESPVNNLSTRRSSSLPSDFYNKDFIDDTEIQIGGIGTQEVFIFEFGSVCFWGFSRGDELEAIIMNSIKKFAMKGLVPQDEFIQGEDDMAFVTSPTAEKISIGNDVITLPDETSAKQRLAVSYAIAQSTVLAIFEARIERKMEEYKYIPETLAAVGSVHLDEKQLGIMIGEVFVVRHDVNLHSDILDTPDFFWEEDRYEPQYRMVMTYLEMTGRVEVVNKRLDMLRELLDVLQQQMEAHHAVTLEWIVIWLIVIEVVIELVAIFGQVFGLWNVGRR